MILFAPWTPKLVRSLLNQISANGGDPAVLRRLGADSRMKVAWDELLKPSRKTNKLLYPVRIPGVAIPSIEDQERGLWDVALLAYILATHEYPAVKLADLQRRRAEIQADANYLRHQAECLDGPFSPTTNLPVASDAAATLRQAADLREEEARDHLKTEDGYGVVRRDRSGDLRLKGAIDALSELMEEVFGSKLPGIAKIIAKVALDR